MGTLFRTIQQSVRAGQYLVGEHAATRLEERGMLEWQVVDGLAAARLLKERPHSKPNPSIEVLQILANGAEITVVWSYLKSANIAKLVTVYFSE